MRKYAILGAILVLLASAIALIYYLVNFLAKVNLLWYAGEVSWLGAITGFAGCLFLSSLIMTISLIATKSRLTKKRSLVFLMLILSALITAILWFFKPGDSDVWWYGAIAGFFSCLLLAFLVLIIYLVFKLKRNRERMKNNRLRHKNCDSRSTLSFHLLRLNKIV